LIEPIQGIIRTPRIIIIQDGVLRVLPFAELHDGSRYFGHAFFDHQSGDGKTVEGVAGFYLSKLYLRPDDPNKESGTLTVFEITQLTLKRVRRNWFHILFQCALRWEFIVRNPISLVRQSTARKGIPPVLTPEEFKARVKELEEP